MDFDAKTLDKILAVCTGEESGGPEETVLVMRQGQPSLAPTMYSVWLREGEPLNPGLRYELELQRDRITRYREVAAELATLAPAAVPLKGLQVGSLYPADVVRYMNDLDYAVPDEAALWPMCRLLVDRGWEVDSGTFVRIGGRFEVMISFRQSNEDRYALPYGVEVGTHLTLGDLAGVPPLVEMPPSWRVNEVKNLTMLFYERFEQRYRARDLLDAALQFEALAGRHHLLVRETDRLDLWPEYAELRTLLAAIDAPVLPPPVPDGAVARSKARRAARLLHPFRRPAGATARNLQRRMIYGELTGPEKRAWALASARMKPGWALRAGLLCFGLPVDAGPRPERAVVGEREDVLWVDTPIGRFVLTPGSEVREEALDLLPDNGPAPAEPSPPRAELPVELPVDVPEPTG